MSKLWIDEFEALGTDRNGRPTSVPQYPPVASQTPITLSASSVQSAVFGATTRFVRLRADGIAHIAVGTNPTATTNSSPFDANQAEFIGVSPGHRLAAYLG